MTDTDLNSRLARMETSLRHIEQDVQDAKQERTDAARQTQDFMARLVKLEAGDKALSGIPDRVAHAEATNEVQEAVKTERAQIIREIRMSVYGGIGAAATIIGGIVWIVGT